MEARKKGRQKESNLNNKNRHANREMEMNVAAAAAAASIGIEIHTKSISRIHKTNMIQCTHPYRLAWERRFSLSAPKNDCKYFSHCFDY